MLKPGQVVVQEVRKAKRGRGTSAEWTHKELKDLVDWLVGLGPGRTEELKHSVRLWACALPLLFDYARNASHLQRVSRRHLPAVMEISFLHGDSLQKPELPVDKVWPAVVMLSVR